MSEEHFSFRWGIPLLDKGDTRVPNFFFDRYTEAGVTRTQFLTILHLARYQYESRNSQCRPSVPTVAKQMGYSVRGLQKVFTTMAKAGILERRYRRGYATIYDFTGFSYAVLKAELYARSTPPEAVEQQLHFMLKLGGEPQFTPSGEPQFTSVVNPSSPEEEKEEEQGRSGGGGLSAEGKVVFVALTDFGVSPTVARKLALKRGLDQVVGWITYAEGASSLRDPEGFVVKRLLDNVAVPVKGKKRGGRGNDFTTMVCKSCWRVVVVGSECSDCNLCSKCCECRTGEGESDGSE